LSEQFNPREDFSLRDFLRRSEEPATSVTGSIQVDSFAAERVRKEAPFKVLQEERNEQSVTFTIEGGNWNWYLGWLLSFGNRLIVIAPDDLRTLLFETAQATTNHHALVRGPDR
jgi:predicted DNA-binding transcriptional regulator YafY